MKRTYFFLPLAALIAFAAYLGFQRGQLPTDTEIINRYAAIYLHVAPEGAQATDCAAQPVSDKSVRMMIFCAHSSGPAWTYFVGPRGDTVPPPGAPAT